MKIIPHLLFVLCVTLSSCGIKSAGQQVEKDKEPNYVPATNLEKSVLKFSKSVLKEKLNVIVHERVSMWYWDIQMIFESDDFRSDFFSSYITFSDGQRFDKSVDGNYDGVILFMTPYKDVKSAKHAYQELKSYTKIRIAELEGYAGLLVEQVRVLERIRKSGGLFTQKGKYVFYLVESCEKPPVGASWEDYENLFLRFITKKNEEIEITNANCEEDVFLVQKVKATR